MKLSIIIVNYNVETFLDQCLTSVYNALKSIDSEVFVVDNHSVDGSIKMLRQKFPQVNLIENNDNLGFSCANNQAIKLSSGEYVLLLNPDTVVQDDTFEKIITFMDNKPQAGGLGVKMVDGKGKFLPESKRGLPTPEVAFYKIFGLSVLLPNSKRFGRYHLGYLENDSIHEVDVLSGAFMLVRKEVMDKIGLLDESFFMYGEDIDLSYRIIKEGYKNYYFPSTTIIHYKGESTKKTSINYVFIFYNAMRIFASKHFSKKNAKLFSFLINIAIYFRALLSIIKRGINSIFFPLLDFIVFFVGFYLLKINWETIVLNNASYYPDFYQFVIIPSYIFIWVLSIFLSGGYDKPVKIKNLISGILFGTLIILVFYALLSESLRFSRALILLDSVWVLFSSIAIRFIAHYIGNGNFKIGSINNSRFAIVGKANEILRVEDILRKTYLKIDIIIYVSADELYMNDFYSGTKEQLNEIIQIHKIEEVIFCGKDLSAGNIIQLMTKLQNPKIDFKIAPSESFYLIGSNSIDSSGDIYMLQMNAVNKPENKRKKRLFDITLSFLALISYPLIFLLYKQKYVLFKNILCVLVGKLTWVGFAFDTKNQGIVLPNLRNGVLNPSIILKSDKHLHNIDHLNITYARNYSIINDINIFIKGIKLIDRKNCKI